MRTTHLARLSAALLAASTITSLNPRAEAQHRKLDPLVLRALHTGVSGPRSLQMGPLKPGVASVMLELAAPATAQSLEQLRALGARLREVDGRTLHHRRWVPASVDALALQALLASPLVSRVAPPPMAGLPPLDQSAALIGLDGAWGSRPALDLLTGMDIVVADLDGNADVFHPQFFRADAGYFDWIDVNQDGVFDPGKDAIDLNRDGIASDTEVAVLLRAETLSLFYGEKVPARGIGFDPSIDWIYLDENGNGERDYGSVDGFDDQAPALGEPLFVPDDLNRNGKLDAGERFARLGTSKFSKVYVHIEHYADIDHVFERGVDLSTHQNDYTGYVSGYSDALHGSGVLSIIAADVPLAGRRWVGVAPDADLLLGFEIAQDASKSLTWALAEKPDVMLHETAGWVGNPMDGSDVYSLAVDDSVTVDGVSHTCPTGNLGGARKHAEVNVAAGQSTTLAMDLPDFGAQGLAYYVDISLNFRGAAPAALSLREPGGQEHDIGGSVGYTTLSTGASAYISRASTSRGTDFVDVVLYTPPQQAATKPIPIGAWEVRVLGNAQNDATLHAYVMDDISGWGVGAAWDPAIASDASTAGIPSVADECIAVGAHTGHLGSAAEPWFTDLEGPGELRGYSGRGPRIDGEQKPDIAAPDNPWSAAPADKSYLGETMPHGAVWPFGGTSGATPHVTGVTALLAQAGIRGLAARSAIRDGALVDTKTGPVPNTEFGWGRLSAAGALGGSASGEAPEVSLTADPSTGVVGESVTLEVAASDLDGPASALEAKWDDGYDGTWDEPYGPVASRVVSHTSAGRYPYKVRVRDGEGRFSETVLWLEISEVPVVEPDAGIDAEADGGVDAAADGPSLGRWPGGSRESDGCGCRAAGAPRGASAYLLLGLGAVAVALRGRRRVRAGV